MSIIYISKWKDLSFWEGWCHFCLKGLQAFKKCSKCSLIFRCLELSYCRSSIKVFKEWSMCVCPRQVYALHQCRCFTSIPPGHVLIFYKWRGFGPVSELLLEISTCHITVLDSNLNSSYSNPASC